MLRAFLAQRVPPPPAPLATWLDGVETGEDATATELLRVGLGELNTARSVPGRVRESAFHLLAADALITYACEVALEGEHPRARFADFVQRAAASEP